MTLLAALSLTAMVALDQPTYCPVNGEVASKETARVDYNGVRYSFCCDGCPQEFAKNPTKYANKFPGKTIGVYLFEPITHKRISSDDSVASEDFKGVRYYFSSKANMAAFDKVKSTWTPGAKSALSCPVTGEKIEGYASAGGAMDYKGVRYFMCCPGCVGTFAKNPAKYAAKAQAKAGAPKAIVLDK